MQHDPTTTTQEELLYEEQLAHEHGMVLPDRVEHDAGDEAVDDVVFPYAYALEAVVT